jgi:hypothetical protein
MLTRCKLTKITKTLAPSAEQQSQENGIQGGFTTEPVSGECFTLWNAGTSLCYVRTSLVRKVVLKGHNEHCKGIWIFDTQNNTYLVEEI